MNILCQSTRIYRQNVGQLRVRRATVTSSRALSTSQWKKYLTILDIKKDSTSKEIKDSFLKLSKVYHPDNKSTGSHAKFVELKEAYDALKDGHPQITSYSSSTYSSANRSNHFYDNDVSYQAHRAYRERYGDYTYSQSNYGFGGPYRNSSSPWEDLKRDREYRRQKERYESFSGGRGRSLINVTIILSTMAWIVIYSSVLLIWDYNDSLRKDMFSPKSRSEEYLQYQEYLKRRETARTTREQAMKNPKYVVDDVNPAKSYITSNNQRILAAVPATDTTSLSPSLTPLKVSPIDIPSNVSHDDPDVVGAL